MFRVPADTRRNIKNHKIEGWWANDQGLVGNELSPGLSDFRGGRASGRWSSLKTGSRGSDWGEVYRVEGWV